MSATPTDPPKAEEVSLEDIDKILEAEDPEFTKELEGVRAVEIDKDVEIETGVAADDELGEDRPGDAAPLKGFKLYKTKIKDKIFAFRMRMKARLATGRKDLLIWLKTKPKEYAIYSVAMSKVLVKKATYPVKAFGAATRLQKLTVLLLCGLAAVAASVLFWNMRGVWLPQINEPLLQSLTVGADKVETYDPKQEGESFYAAFPQERHEYLFDRIKVNLKRSTENPNPMGAFEIIVLLDSKDTAIEVADRRVEFFDDVQRVFEDHLVTDLDTEIGKERLKAGIKRELNAKLTQGWVKDVNFKTFVLKP
ncbi:MAG TPA: flagellar basal body-associated FliL family protein [Bdellovibrionales bacterium]|nr:flagellar basal body-associated FliL family protein [Bdellovibrionales bacterium]